MDVDRIKEVFSDEEFVKSLFELETPEEVQAALEPKGVDMSIQEICQLRDILVMMVEKGSTELTEEELEQVAGGSILAAVGAAAEIGAIVLISVAITFAVFDIRW